MSLLRRYLLMAILTGDSGNLVLSFLEGIATLNDEGRGRKITVSGTEVVLSE